MEAPTPDNIAALWVNLHEFQHFRLHGAGLPIEGNNHSRAEAEANLAVMRILDEEGVVAPLDVLVEEYQFSSRFSMRIATLNVIRYSPNASMNSCCV
jgi:hypothetical protein